jgi:hypothetical protein
MCSCGPIGKERADQVLLRVPIGFKPSTGDVNAAVHMGEVPAALKAVIETCHEYGREAVRRMVCTVFVLSTPFVCFLCLDFAIQIAARNFLQHREYGLAVSYATSAENWTWLGRIVDAVLAEYIKHGLSIFLAPCRPYSRNHRTRNLCPVSSCSCAVTASAASTSRRRWRIHSPAHVCCPLRRVSSTKIKR